MYTTRGQAVYIDERGRCRNITAAARDCKMSYQHLHELMDGTRVSTKGLERVKKAHPELLEIGKWTTLLIDGNYSSSLSKDARRTRSA